jgi:RNA polymerase sigma-70 factor (ECF subfamily)
MYRITTNCFLDIRKKKQVHTSLAPSFHNDGHEVECQLADMRPSPFDIAVSNEQVAAVSSALCHLKESQQAMLRLRYTEMRSYDEIAIILGLPIGTVKSRLNRARARLFTVMNSRQSSKPRSSRPVLLAA